MPVGFGKRALKSRGRPLTVMAHFKRSNVELKADEKFPARALVIAISRLEHARNIIRIEDIVGYVMSRT